MTLKITKQTKDKYHRLTIRLPLPLLQVISKIEEQELCLGANQAIIEALKYYDKATTKIVTPKPSHIIR